MFLMGLMGLTGNLTAMAQVPEPTGQWKFDNPSDLLAASKGSLTLSPAVLGDHSISEATIGEAGIVAADGVAAEDGAILVPKTAAMKLQRAEGASATMSYTFMLDMKVPDAYVYDAIFQTNGDNTNDAELFISKSQIGLGGYLGGYYGRIWNDTWYRIVYTMSDGYAKLYVNGKKIINYETSDGRFELDPWGFYLFCDENGEASDTYVSEVAFWETPLTDEEVAACAEKLRQQGAQNVLVSLGGDGALLAGEDGKTYRCQSPKGALVNSVGAGDSMVAGFLAGYERSGGNLSEALRYGIASGSATAFKDWLAEREEIEALLAGI